MKHKTDAKLKASEIISEHMKNGCSEIISKMCVITTVDLILSNIRYGTEHHSLFMRTRNYLMDS